jgi:hypothetical protein
MAHARGSSHLLEDAALILLGVAQTAVLASWAVSSATSAVNAFGFGAPNNDARAHENRRWLIAGTLGFGAIVAAALVRRHRSRARTIDGVFARLDRTMPATQTAEVSGAP